MAVSTPGEGELCKGEGTFIVFYFITRLLYEFLPASTYYFFKFFFKSIFIIEKNKKQKVEATEADGTTDSLLRFSSLTNTIHMGARPGAKWDTGSSPAPRTPSPGASGEAQLWDHGDPGSCSFLLFRDGQLQG